MQTHLESASTRPGDSHALEPLGVGASSPAERSVPCMENRRGLVRHRGPPTRSKMWVTGPKQGVDAFGGGNSGLLEVRPPIGDEIVDSGTDVPEGTEKAALERMSDHDRPKGVRWRARHNGE